MRNNGYNSSHTLVLGWGNELRGDDGAGRVAARAIADRQWPQVCVEDIHQLTPEWAAHLRSVQCAIFLDACRADQWPPHPALPAAPWQQQVCVQSLIADPAAATPHSVHRVSPAYILALANQLYDVRPEAWWIGIPLVQTELGAPLSAVARAGVAAAVEACHYLINDSARIVAEPAVAERKSA